YKLDSLGNVYQLNYKPESEEKFFIWVGKNRNIEFKKAYKISGNLDSLNFNSKFLNEYRPIVTYYPENYDKNTPIIYILDGEMINDLYPYIDQMIKDKKIVNLILVGIYSSDKFRYNEYVEGSTNNSNFKKHQNFFYKEVLGHTEVKLNKWRGSRYVFGVSNGGAFAMHAGLNNPNMFKEVIAFSVADYITEFSKPINIKRDQKYPNFYMGAGVYESSFYNDNLRFSKKLAQNNIEVSFNSFCSGHDYIVWKFEFLDYVVKRFKNI
ncbi:MAG TPA: alpha/beta hydrolase-fold protein, partial [Saprospiraceae bacterium]|nr:alpha/beta hydrolase-fold protein [Saprospiraceae bacterium]